MSGPKPMLDALAEKVMDYQGRSCVHLERFEAAVRADERERVATALWDTREFDGLDRHPADFVRKLK